MSSTLSIPAVRRASATKLAARSTSARFSARVLMLGMRRNCFSSSRRRCRLSLTKASVAADMVSPWVEKPLYGAHLGRLGRRPRAGVIQDAADFGFVEGLGEQVVSAQVEGFGPETGIRLRIGDDHFGFSRAFADEVQDIEPLAIGQVGFGKNDVVIRLVEPRTRMAQRWRVLQLQGKRMQHLGEVESVFLAPGDKQDS